MVFIVKNLLASYLYPPLRPFGCHVPLQVRSLDEGVLAKRTVVLAASVVTALVRPQSLFP